MYKMNSLLKFIVAILTIAIIVITNNRIILWLLLVLLTFYNFLKNKSKLLVFIDLILVVLLGLSTEKEIFLLIFKAIFIVNYLLTIYKSLSLKDKKNLVRENRSLKHNYYEENFDRIVRNINEKKELMYDKDVSIDYKIERDLERAYLQSRIRYNTISKKNKWYNWNKIDTMVLFLYLILFVILFILR